MAINDWDSGSKKRFHSNTQNNVQNNVPRSLSYQSFPVPLRQCCFILLLSEYVVTHTEWVWRVGANFILGKRVNCRKYFFKYFRMHSPWPSIVHSLNANTSAANEKRTCTSTTVFLTPAVSKIYNINPLDFINSSEAVIPER